LSCIAELRFGSSAFRHTVSVFGVVLDPVIVDLHSRTPFWSSAFRHTVFVFGVVLDQVIVELHSRTPFWVLRISAYRFCVRLSVGSGHC
jgi:hypothetical protein